jgi:hypothetical protein
MPFISSRIGTCDSLFLPTPAFGNIENDIDVESIHALQNAFNVTDLLYLMAGGLESLGDQIDRAGMVEFRIGIRGIVLVQLIIRF